MELSVRKAMISVLAEGNDKYPGLGMVRAVEKMVIMKCTNRLLTQVYGNLQNQNDPSIICWNESTAKVVRVLSRLERIGAPRPRQTIISVNRRKSLVRTLSRRQSITKVVTEGDNWEESFRSVRRLSVMSSDNALLK